MSDRLRFALRNVESSQWQIFERFASQFLSEEYADLRTLASGAGDAGRDSVIFQPDSYPQVALQYSLRIDWDRKIRQTAARLHSQHPEVNVLIFATPFEVGAKADPITKELRERFELFLDVRDENWFCERSSKSSVTQAATDDFCRKIVDPILAESELVDRSKALLSDHEARAVLLYLTLQRQDDDLDRHLTKLCFDAIVRAVLRNTHSDDRITRQAIYKAVDQLLPTHPIDEVHMYVDRALTRLNKKFIRHWKKLDEFCLTHEERVRLKEGVARLELIDDEFGKDLDAAAGYVAESLGVDLSLIDRNEVLGRVRRVMERFLFERGEAFAQSLSSGQTFLFAQEELHEIVREDVAAHPDTSSLRENLPLLIGDTVERMLLYPGEASQRYLRALSEAYTLLAFLRETPNVQSAVNKLFSHGEFWLDTSAVMPVMVEELLDPEERRYTHLVRALTDAGVRLFLTNGVIDELESHLLMSLSAWRNPHTWNGRTPFMLSSYVWAGREWTEFPKFVERFRGGNRPRDDIVEYLSEVHKIALMDLKVELEQADDELRWQTDEYWRRVHSERRQPSPDPAVVDQLVSHDTENFLGVLMRRGGEEVGNPFGYSTWWLTLDRHAAKAVEAVSDQAGVELDSPVLSFEFLAYYLAIGPIRRRLTKKSQGQMPLLFENSLLDALPSELMERADGLRQELSGLEERVIRRRVRDHLDQEKISRERNGRVGIEALITEIKEQIQETRS